MDWVRRLFEKAVGGFYQVVLSRSGWRIETGKTLNWPIEKQTLEISKIFPRMQTDIVLDKQVEGRRIVVDTKFTSILVKGYYREKSLRSNYLYQIYSYLRSQEENSDYLWKNASGVLLHPAIDCFIDEAVLIQGHEVRFITVNLGAQTSEIRKQLLQVIKPRIEI